VGLGKKFALKMTVLLPGF